MSRTLGGPLAAHIATRSHTRSVLMLLDLRDGTTIGVTDHDQDIDFDIGDGVETYRAGTGIFPSDIALSAGLETDNCEVRGPIDDVVTLTGVLGGRFDRAEARLFQVNWKSLGSGAIKILAGNVSQARVEGGRFVFEIRSNVDRLNQVVGKLIVNNCDADFGDTRCGATPTSVVGTVTAVTSAMIFAVSYTGSYANDFFNLGTVEPLTGANAGGLPVEIFDWSLAGGIELFTPLASDPVIGDTFTIKDGCSKLRRSDVVGVPTCMSHNNIVNFRGFPEVPGSDQILRATIPGQGNEE